MPAVRLPVASMALMRYAALTSLSHESTGRKVKMDEIDWHVGKLKAEVRDALTGLTELISDEKTSPVLIPRNRRENKFFTTE